MGKRKPPVWSDFVMLSRCGDVSISNGVIAGGQVAWWYLQEKQPRGAERVAMPAKGRIYELRLRDNGKHGSGSMRVSMTTRAPLAVNLQLAQSMEKAFVTNTSVFSCLFPWSIMRRIARLGVRSLSSIPCLVHYTGFECKATPPIAPEVMSPKPKVDRLALQKRQLDLLHFILSDTEDDCEENQNMREFLAHVDARKKEVTSKTAAHSSDVAPVLAPVVAPPVAPTQATASQGSSPTKPSISLSVVAPPKKAKYSAKQIAILNEAAQQSFEGYSVPNKQGVELESPELSDNAQDEYQPEVNLSEDDQPEVDPCEDEEYSDVEDLPKPLLPNKGKHFLSFLVVFDYIQNEARPLTLKKLDSEYTHEEMTACFLRVKKVMFPKFGWDTNTVHKVIQQLCEDNRRNDRRCAALALARGDTTAVLPPRKVGRPRKTVTDRDTTPKNAAEIARELDSFASFKKVFSSKSAPVIQAARQNSGVLINVHEKNAPTKPQPVPASGAKGKEVENKSQAINVPTPFFFDLNIVDFFATLQKIIPSKNKMYTFYLKHSESHLTIPESLLNQVSPVDYYNLIKDMKTAITMGNMHLVIKPHMISEDESNKPKAKAPTLVNTNVVVTKSLSKEPKVPAVVQHAAPVVPVVLRALSVTPEQDEDATSRSVTPAAIGEPDQANSVSIQQIMEDLHPIIQQNDTEGPVSPKRGRGRPKSSRNKASVTPTSNKSMNRKQQTQMQLFVPVPAHSPNIPLSPKNRAQKPTNEGDDVPELCNQEMLEPETEEDA
ncbi:hypothetical protein DFH27DRAFT_625143 [Peziza echinospora]|nr:hypothetical protein DFH27DRAFT_625143 [Peziza echinospora]